MLPFVFILCPLISLFPCVSLAFTLLICFIATVFCFNCHFAFLSNRDAEFVEEDLSSSEINVRESLNSRHVVIQLVELGSQSLLALFCSIMRKHVVRNCIYFSPVLLHVGYISF